MRMMQEVDVPRRLESRIARRAAPAVYKTSLSHRLVASATILQAPVAAPPELFEAPLHSSPVRVMWPLNCRNSVLVIFKNNFPHSSYPGGTNRCLNLLHAFLHGRSPTTPFTVHGKLAALCPCFVHTKEYGTGSFETLRGAAYEPSSCTIPQTPFDEASVLYVGRISIGHANQFSSGKPLQFSRKRKSYMLGLRCL
jgi:hypothetical protein